MKWIEKHNTEGEKKKDINKIVGDQTSESILKIWSQANPDAKNDQLFGKHRDAVMEVKGGRQFSQKELDASRAAIPKFQDPRETAAAKAQKASVISIFTRCNGLVENKQTETGNAKRNEDNVLDSNYMAWIGGQLTLQSESNPNDLQKSHDIISKSYFDRVMSEKEYVMGKAKKEKREKAKLRSKFELDGRERKIKETEIAK
ncbi:unnamed protein product [Onchocerca flexuosa]|uniref:Uncharacterized protein n=1 Tax=Onchocerca flexuosa TaxID=387005 RepID=A0A183HLW7_9BILA|nr:unnamed protein product [Onchocerca flexuosa]